MCHLSWTQRNNVELIPCTFLVQRSWSVFSIWAFTTKTTERPWPQAGSTADIKENDSPVCRLHLGLNSRVKNVKTVAGRKVHIFFSTRRSEQPWNAAASSCSEESLRRRLDFGLGGQMFLSERSRIDWVPSISITIFLFCGRRWAKLNISISVAIVAARRAWAQGIH